LFISQRGFGCEQLAQSAFLGPSPTMKNTTGVFAVSLITTTLQVNLMFLLGCDFKKLQSTVSANS
jgi:hypothetical protein